MSASRVAGEPNKESTARLRDTATVIGQRSSKAAAIRPSPLNDSSTECSAMMRPP
jgi:hypothetical protein